MEYSTIYSTEIKHAVKCCQWNFYQSFYVFWHKIKEAFLLEFSSLWIRLDNFC